MGWKEKGCSPVPRVGKGYRPVSAATPFFRRGERDSAPPPRGLLSVAPRDQDQPPLSCASEAWGSARGLGINEIAEWCPGGSASSAARRAAAACIGIKKICRWPIIPQCDCTNSASRAVRGLCVGSAWAVCGRGVRGAWAGHGLCLGGAWAVRCRCTCGSLAFYGVRWCR